MYLHRHFGLSEESKKYLKEKDILEGESLAKIIVGAKTRNETYPRREHEKLLTGHAQCVQSTLCFFIIDTRTKVGRLKVCDRYIILGIIRALLW